MESRNDLAALAAALLAFAFAVSGCGSGHSEDDDHAGHGDEPGEERAGDHDEGSEVTLTPAQIKLAEISTSVVSRGEIEIEVALTGELALNQDRLAHIIPRAPGIVEAVRKTLGDRVRAGEVLAVLKSTELGEAKADYLNKKQVVELALTDLSRSRTIHDNTVRMLVLLKKSPSLADLKPMNGLDMGQNRSALVSSYSELVFARAKYLREKNLYEQKITSSEEYLEAESEYRKNDAEYAATFDQITFAIKRELLEKERAHKVAAFSLRAAGRRLHILGLNDADVRALSTNEKANEDLAQYALTAPIDGTIIEKHITQGEKVGEESQLYTICDLSTVWLIASVYEKDVSRVRRGQQAVFTTKAYPGSRFQGQITWIAATIDEGTRTLKARIEVANSDGRLKPGMFARVTLNVETRRNVIVIPLSALQRQKDETIVFVDEGGGRFERREVKIGIRSATSAEILDGLKVGENIVTQGGFTLKSEIEKAGFHAGHAH